MSLVAILGAVIVGILVVGVIAVVFCIQWADTWGTT